MPTLAKMHQQDKIKVKVWQKKPQIFLGIFEVFNQFCSSK